ncbi:unnamed protein product [Ceutorhynchus assimilis]|uniref:Pleckstrin homology domain-containing family J member 1 n=1 Tax=Ceutorhynchus assimilis TaxID=467358 RepID=A0A9N9M8J1_9CUCU|nr:unnamed protein product [Ceutorhynchus assimilis]
MRFNDKEISKMSESKADLEGVLNHMKPQGNEWYQQPIFKERLFKLKGNMLFYHRINEQEPLGLLVLENAHVAYERPHKGIFAFSLSFKVNDKFRDNEAKHIFSCRTDDDVNKWVSALKIASYEYWRSQSIILRTKLAMKTGKDPILEYLRNKEASANISHKVEARVEVKKTKTKEIKSTFHSHLETETFHESSATSCSSREIISNNTNQTNGTPVVENFILF